MIAVSDNGMGMTPEVKTHLFEPFFTTKDKQTGTGFGLATSYGIISQAGGHIVVYSEPGKGSTFKIYLPRVENPSKIPVVQGNQETFPRGNEKILIVDDDPGILDILSRILQDLGYDVTKAQDQEEALQAMAHPQKGNPDLLLTDVFMPKINGTKLAALLLQKQPGMKVIFMSGYADESIVQYGILQAGWPFIQKPISKNILARKIRDVLDT
jgi:CheY-like chemotaxis protein